MASLQTQTLRPSPTRNYSSSERGQSIVIVTLLFIGAVAMLGLVIDGGNAYLQRRRMQNAADGAAFAGAIKLANPGTLTGRNLECAIRYEIEKFATLNGVPGPTPQPNCGTYNTNILANYIDQSGNSVGTYVGLYYGVPTTARGISVTVRTDFNTFFLGVVGQSSGAASAPAKASFAPILSPESVQPLARKCDQPTLEACGFQYGTSYDIWQGDTSGNFGWLCWRNKSCNAEYTADELNPNGGTLAGYKDPHGVCPDGHIASSYNGSPCWVNGNTGVSDKKEIRDWLDYWIAQGAKTPPVPMVTVIYDQSEGSGSNSNYRIKGFAAFILQSYDLPTGHGGVVYGKFIKWIAPGDLCTSCNDYGLTGVHLRP